MLAVVRIIVLLRLLESQSLLESHWFSLCVPVIPTSSSTPEVWLPIAQKYVLYVIVKCVIIVDIL